MPLVRFEVEYPFDERFTHGIINNKGNVALFSKIEYPFMMSDYRYRASVEASRILSVSEFDELCKIRGVNAHGEPI